MAVAKLPLCQTGFAFIQALIPVHYYSHTLEALKSQIYMPMPNFVLEKTNEIQMHLPTPKAQSNSTLGREH